MQLKQQQAGGNTGFEFGWRIDLESIGCVSESNGARNQRGCAVSSVTGERGKDGNVALISVTYSPSLDNMNVNMIT